MDLLLGIFIGVLLVVLFAKWHAARELKKNQAAVQKRLDELAAEVSAAPAWEDKDYV